MTDPQRESLALECTLADNGVRALATRYHNAILGEDASGKPCGMDLEVDQLVGNALDRQAAAYKALDAYDDAWTAANFG